MEPIISQHSPGHKTLAKRRRDRHESFAQRRKEKRSQRHRERMS